MSTIKLMIQQMKSDLKSHPMVFGLAGFTMIALIGVAGYLGYNAFFNTLSPDDIDKNEKRRILNEVIRNNPKGVVADATGIEQDSYTNNPVADLERDLARAEVDSPDPSVTAKIPVPNVSTNRGYAKPADIVIPDLSKYNYRETTITSQIGPAIDSCLSYGGERYIQTGTELYQEFFDTSHAMYKYQHHDEDKDLLNYSLARYGNDVNDNYYYIGGDTAAHLKFSVNKDFTNTYFPESYAPSSYPNSYPNSYPTGIYDPVSSGSYFGYAQEITDVEEIEGVTYYEITAYNYRDCYQESGGNEEHKIYMVFRIKGDDYKIENVKYYLNDVKPDNLLYVINTNIETKKTDYSQVVKTFNFLEPAKILDVDYANYTFDADKQAKKTADYLKSKDIDLMLVKNTSVDLSNVSGHLFPDRVKNEKYYLREDYYPSTAKGQERYQELMDYISSRPVVEEWFYDSALKKSFDVEIFENTTVSKIEEKKIDEFPYDANLYKSFKKINIDRQAVVTNYVAMEYVYDYKYPDSYPSSFPASYMYPASYPGTNSIIRVSKEVYIFERNGKVYAMSVYVGNSAYGEVQSRDFGMADVSTSAGYKFTLSELKNTYIHDGWYFCGS